jgi:hypothetical protein
MNTELLLGLVILAGGIGMYWLAAKKRLGAYLFFSFCIGSAAYLFLLFGLGIFCGVCANVPLIGAVVIGIVSFIFAWVKRDEPMDKITEQYFRSGTGGRKDGIDIDGGDGGE